MPRCVRCLARLSLEASCIPPPPPRLSYPPQLCETDPPAHVAVDADGGSSVPPCFGEPASETKNKNKRETERSRAYDLARHRRISTAAVSKTKSRSTVYFPLLV